MSALLGMVGWIVDLMVSWLVGSIVGGLALDLVGTVVGVVLMRRARGRRKAANMRAVPWGPEAPHVTALRGARPRIIVLLLFLAALALGGCSGPSQSVDSSTDGQSSQTTNAPDDHDLRLLAKVHGSIRSWNAVTGPVVSAFRDPAVTAEQFESLARPSVGQIKMLARALTTDPVGFHDTGLASAFVPIGTAYEAEAVDYELLIDAVSRGDQAGQIAIANRLRVEGQQKSRDVLALVAYARKKYGDDFADALTSSAQG